MMALVGSKQEEVAALKMSVAAAIFLLYFKLLEELVHRVMRPHQPHYTHPILHQHQFCDHRCKL